MCLETVEALFRLAAMRCKPILSQAQGIEVQRADARPSLPFRCDEPGVFQNTQVLRKRRQSHVEQLRKLRNGCRTADESLDDGTPRWIGKCLEGCFDVNSIIRHIPNLGLRST